VTSRFGKGHTLFVGTYLGWGNHPEQTPSNTAFILRLADWAGIDKPVATSLDGQLAEPVVARLQENPNGYLLFVINHGEAAQSPTVTVRVTDGNYLLTDLTSTRQQSVTARGGALQFNTSIGARDVGVWSIARR
ncbi:MAG TPA: hypothetical protein VFO52_06435, partial [Longimicrobiales bacterium]|nr:hypothetical protein [Longimicrobiales bacterium]